MRYSCVEVRCYRKRHHNPSFAVCDSVDICCFGAKVLRRSADDKAIPFYCLTRLEHGFLSFFDVVGMLGLGK